MRTLDEKQRPFAEYLDIVPKNYDECPIMFTDEEKEWLKGSSFLKQIEGVH
jgi:hypothetical protein